MCEKKSKENQKQKNVKFSLNGMRYATDAIGISTIYIGLTFSFFVYFLVQCGRFRRIQNSLFQRCFEFDKFLFRLKSFRKVKI